MAERTNKPAFAEIDMANEKTIELPSGRTAVVREGRGRDMMNAHRVLPPNAAADPTAVMFALVAQLATIEGHAVLYEDVLEMPLPDVIALQTEIADRNFQGAPPPTSQDSSNSDSNLPN